MPKLGTIDTSLYEDIALFTSSYKIDTIQKRLSDSFTKLCKYFTKKTIKITKNKIYIIIFETYVMCKPFSKYIKHRA